MTFPALLWNSAQRRCGEIGAAFLNVFVAFPRFVWLELLRPALDQRRLHRALIDETRRLFYLQGIAPLHAHRSLMTAIVALLALAVGSQVAVYGLHASVEGIAAKFVAYTLVPAFSASYLVLGGAARGYVTMNRARLRGEHEAWRQWGTSPWLMQGCPQVAAMALSSFSLALLNLVTLLFAEPLLSGVQHALLPQVPPLDLSRYLTPGLFALAIVKTMAISVGVAAWFVYRVAAAEKPNEEFDGIVANAARPFAAAWLGAEAFFWWAAPL